MATDVQVSDFSTKHKLLDAHGPTCLIIQAEMGVAAGLDRFQPAGFPEVGHVIYDAPRSDGRSEKVCIVDSPASMANHLEQVCLAGENDPNLHPDLAGLPYINCVTDRDPTINGGSVTLKCDDPRDRVVTTSLTEGHRIASDYFLDGLPAPRWVEETKTRVKKGDKEEEKVAPAHWEGESFRDILRGSFASSPLRRTRHTSCIQNPGGRSTGPCSSTIRTVWFTVSCSRRNRSRSAES